MAERLFSFRSLCSTIRADRDHAFASLMAVRLSGLFGSGLGCFGFGLRVVNRNSNST